MRYKKVIFLDIDGVLNSKSADMRILDHKAIALLKKLVEKYKAVIVITSVWRKFDWPQRILRAFLKAGWENPPIIDKTPVLFTTRGKEIQSWLSQNQVESFVIIDDDSDMLPEHLNNFVKCDTMFGLTKKQVKMIDEIFSQNKKSP